MPLKSGMNADKDRAEDPRLYSRAGLSAAIRPVMSLWLVRVISTLVPNSFHSSFSSKSFCVLAQHDEVWMLALPPHRSNLPYSPANACPPCGLGRSSWLLFLSIPLHNGGFFLSPLCIKIRHRGLCQKLGFACFVICYFERKWRDTAAAVDLAVLFKPLSAV